MKSYAIVSSKAELKKALERKVEEIVIIDSSLAKNIRIVKYSSRFAIVAATAGAGVAATNFWNPVGLSAGVAAFAVGGSTLTAIVVLGVGAVLIFALYNDYDVKAKGKVKLPDGTEVDGELILSKKIKNIATQ